MSKTIAIGADHAGYLYKARLIEHLKSKGFEVVNVGTDAADSVDYPVFADKVCDCVASGKAAFGILICGTGIGMSMASNKHKGIRAALCTDLVMAEYTRLHNNANVLCLGARIIACEMAEMIADKFLETEFEGGRHQRRIDLFDR
ncbi:MAG: ribose 5-phosphate isomerase B [Spirochaetia bacterium]|uniref:ribose 5-phosphate isomerase B n=1 Tax=Treponema berlinense TaxID=225004 RepID=UPI0026EA98CE|nr:ribose 5-phosphate isomerase B [Treponema berlinense]MDD5789297.1 ribose 5-phosphate isomerase B [Spirochaetia bacterium]